MYCGHVSMHHAYNEDLEWHVPIGHTERLKNSKYKSALEILTITFYSLMIMTPYQTCNSSVSFVIYANLVTGLFICAANTYPLSTH